MNDERHLKIEHYKGTVKLIEKHVEVVGPNCQTNKIILQKGTFWLSRDWNRIFDIISKKKYKRI